MKVYDEIDINTLDDLAKKVFEQLNRGVTSINVVAKYVEASLLIQYLLQENELLIGDIEISAPENSNYSREYLITVGEDTLVHCAPLYFEDRLLYFDGELTYILENCSQKCVKHLPVNDVIIVNYELVYDDEAETENKDIWVKLP